MRRFARAPALIFAGAWLVGCSSCPAPTSTAATVGAPITLDAATSTESRDLVVHAPEQDCGCTSCGDATLALDFSASVSWASPPDASPAPVVRFTLEPRFAPSSTDTLEPPLPLDVVLTAKAPASEAHLQAMHVCPEDDACDLTYRLTITRVEPLQAGSVDVAWTVAVAHASKPDGSLSVTASP